MGPPWGAYPREYGTVGEETIKGCGCGLRISITLSGLSDSVMLPIDHNYLLQAAIYQQIEQPALRSFLHEQGFELGKRKFKLFTFSRLMGKVKVDPQQGCMLFSPPIKLVICSPLAIILQELASSLLKQGYIRLGKEVLHVEKVTATDQVVRGKNITVRMLSPLTVYSTLIDSGHRYTHYYSPFEPRFQELIQANLTKKYWLIFGRQAEEEGFSIEPLSVSEKDFKVVKYKGTIIKGWMGTYRLRGDPQLLEVALNAGLGAKNSQGFGCCELIGVEES